MYRTTPQPASFVGDRLGTPLVFAGMGGLWDWQRIIEINPCDQSPVLPIDIMGLRLTSFSARVRVSDPAASVETADEVIDRVKSGDPASMAVEAYDSFVVLVKVGEPFIATVRLDKSEEDPCQT